MTITGGKRPARHRSAPFFTVNTLISNLGTALKAFSTRHLPDDFGGFCWTTNRRRDMRGMVDALCRAVATSSRLTRKAACA